MEPAEVTSLLFTLMCRFAHLPAYGSCTPSNALRLFKDDDAAFHISALLFTVHLLFAGTFRKPWSFDYCMLFALCKNPGASIRTKLELLD